jgi:hypothetical protein
MREIGVVYMLLDGRSPYEFFFWGGALLHRLRSKRLIREPYEGYTVARSA